MYSQITRTLIKINCSDMGEYFHINIICMSSLFHLYFIFVKIIKNLSGFGSFNLISSHKIKITPRISVRKCRILRFVYLNRIMINFNLRYLSRNETIESVRFTSITSWLYTNIYIAFAFLLHA